MTPDQEKMIKRLNTVGTLVEAVARSAFTADGSKGQISFMGAGLTPDFAAARLVFHISGKDAFEFIESLLDSKDCGLGIYYVSDIEVDDYIASLLLARIPAALILPDLKLLDAVAYTRLRARLDYSPPAKVSALQSEVAEFYKNRK